MSDIPDDLNRKATRILHDRGIELTPAEVIAERKAAFAKIRAHCRTKGIPVPDGDLELLDWMKRIGL